MSMSITNTSITSKLSKHDNKSANNTFFTEIIRNMLFVNRHYNRPFDPKLDNDIDRFAG